MRIIRGIVVGLLLTGGATDGLLARDVGACPQITPSDTVSMPNYDEQTKMAAATARGNLNSASLPIGQMVRLSLSPTGTLEYAAPPGKAGASDSFGGMSRLSVRKSGTYRIALGSAAWVDVIAGERALESTAHGHGEHCSGIHKFVDFDLSPGDYIVQIAGSETPEISLLAQRLP